jgi:predicted phage-related endonuclease
MKRIAYSSKQEKQKICKAGICQPAPAIYETNAHYWARIMTTVLLHEVERTMHQVAIYHNSVILQSCAYPWMLADVSGEGIDSEGKHFCIECKMIRSRDRYLWSKDLIPEEAYFRMMHYLAVGDGYFAYGVFSVLIDADDYRLIRVDWNTSNINDLIEKEKALWEKN